MLNHTHGLWKIWRKVPLQWELLPNVFFIKSSGLTQNQKFVLIRIWMKGVRKNTNFSHKKPLKIRILKFWGWQPCLYEFPRTGIHFALCKSELLKDLVMDFLNLVLLQGNGHFMNWGYTESDTSWQAPLTVRSLWTTFWWYQLNCRHQLTYCLFGGTINKLKHPSGFLINHMFYIAYSRISWRLYKPPPTVIAPLLVGMGFFRIYPEFRIFGG